MGWQYSTVFRQWVWLQILSVWRHGRGGGGTDKLGVRNSYVMLLQSNKYSILLFLIKSFNGSYATGEGQRSNRKLISLNRVLKILNCIYILVRGIKKRGGNFGSLDLVIYLRLESNNVYHFGIKTNYLSKHFLIILSWFLWCKKENNYDWRWMAFAEKIENAIWFLKGEDKLFKFVLKSKLSIF